MKQVIFILLIISTISCGSKSNSSSGSNFDTSGYAIEDLGNGISLLTKKGPEGMISEMGYLKDGYQTGQWLTYNNKGEIKTSTNYILGKKYGKYIEYGNSSFPELIASYKNDQLHGTSQKFASRRVSEEFNYADGELNGLYTLYFKSGPKQKEIEFKNGVQHGKMRYYNEEGILTLEYVYEDGEQISGGAIEN